MRYINRDLVISEIGFGWGKPLAFLEAAGKKLKIAVLSSSREGEPPIGSAELGAQLSVLLLCVSFIVLCAYYE